MFSLNLIWVVQKVHFSVRAVLHTVGSERSVAFRLDCRQSARRLATSSAGHSNRGQHALASRGRSDAGRLWSRAVCDPGPQNGTGCINTTTRQQTASTEGSFAGTVLFCQNSRLVELPPDYSESAHRRNGSIRPTNSLFLALYGASICCHTNSDITQSHFLLESLNLLLSNRTAFGILSRFFGWDVGDWGPISRNAVRNKRQHLTRLLL